MTYSSGEQPNEAQQQAIAYDGGHLLIVAGPGTGKTHTLARRIARVVRGLPAGPKVLAITFTNKAAEEMRARLKQQDNDIENAVLVGTFHSFCLDALRRFAGKTDLPEDFQVAAEEASEQLAQKLWPDKKTAERKALLARISRFKAGCITDIGEELWQYNTALRQKGWLDFDDLLLETVRLLQSDPETLSAIRSTLNAVFVDEYQDINAVQNTLLKLLATGDIGLTAIGDPNQAIYGFRGCDVRFFEKFMEDFPGAKVLSLSANYRSAQNLLAASGQVIAKGKCFPVADLTAQIYAQGRLTIHEAPTDKAEAEQVVHTIEKLVGGTSMFSQDSGRVTDGEEGKYSFGDIAVLYRMNMQRRLLQEAFERSGIPYQVAGEKEDKLPAHAAFRRMEQPNDLTEKVSLLTLHAAKGLEFPVVFIIGCEETLIPLQREALNIDIAEERRLFYVGMTRARERLYFLRAQRRTLFGRRQRNPPSPFLNDIEDALKEIAQVSKRKKRKEEEQVNMF